MRVSETSVARLLAAVALLLPSCDGRSAASPAAPEPAASERVGEHEHATAREPRPVREDQLGTLRVEVRLLGEAPPRRALDIRREPACVHDEPPLTERVVADGDRLANVLVHLVDASDAWIPPPAPSEPAALSQRGCIFVPHVIALRVGQQLVVENRDAIVHDVNLRAKRNEHRNRTQPSGAPALHFDFEHAELSIPVQCDRHPWMGAWIHALDHPWFGVTGADGGASIERVPAGRHRVEALHEAFGRASAEVDVAADGITLVTLTFEVG
jgi:hypothetical protein